MTSVLLTRATLPKFSAETLARTNVGDPNIWFSLRFPDTAKRFGSAFMVQSYMEDGVPRVRPIELNTDFFAAALEGDRRMGHRVVYYLPENTFYFLDPGIGAFCPTTESKLESLLSNYLIRCAQDCSQFADIEVLVTEFRKPHNLRSVIERAKALLAAEQAFFQGEKGHRRMIEGKVIEPTARPSYELFVERTLVKEPSSAVSVTTAFHRYVTFCREHQMTPLTRQEFKSLVAAVVREHFAVGLRNDVPGQNGKAQEGWCGLSLRTAEQAALGLS